MTRAVVLARGLGTRMRAAQEGAHLSPAQQQAADAGLKSMMPVNGRPFVDYVLSVIADAGVTAVALVVAPDHGALRRHFDAVPPARVRLSFVVQREARGTADAVLSAEPWTDGQPFLVMNADNLYPPAALRDLAALAEPGLAVFDADDLVRSSNIPPGRLRAFAFVDVDRQGYLRAIVEKPALPPDGAREDHLQATGVSMNCWRFDARIFAACRDVPESPRGERELPGAVGLALTRGIRFRAVPARGPVLDLSRRADAAALETRLAGVTPCP